jgi:P4 family phage/plasmid primase-like protien
LGRKRAQQIKKTASAPLRAGFIYLFIYGVLSMQHFSNNSQPKAQQDSYIELGISKPTNGPSDPLDNVPSELKQIFQWILYKLEPRTDNRLAKIPVDPITGRYADKTDAYIWHAFKHARKSLDQERRLPLEKQRFHGIGLSLTGTDLVVIDLDKCFEQDGELKLFARDIVNSIPGWVERSVSGKGLHIFTLGNWAKGNVKNNKLGLEVYVDKSFIAVTGEVFEGRNAFPKSLIDLSLLHCYLEQRDTPPKKINSDEYWDHNLPLSDWSIERVRDHLLPYLPDFADYDSWFKVACALKAQFGDDEDAFELFDEYSARDEGLYNPQAVKAAWRAINNDPNRRNITLRWLIAEVNKVIKGFDGETYGDIRNGREFKKLHEGKLLFCHSRGKWLKYDDIVWRWCDGGEELEAAKEVAAEVTRLAAEEFKRDPSSTSTKLALSHARSSNNHSRLEAMLRTASTEQGMKVAQLSSLDSYPLLLGCQNGVVDLRTGGLLAPDPKMLITKQVTAKFNRDAKCPQWLRFMDECFQGDEQTIRYVQKALGYTLTGDVGEELLHFCFGHGRNGKSVFANVIASLMGDYAVTAPAELLMRRDRSGATNDIAMLCGSRLVLANETRSDQRFDDLTIKTLVSTEFISARFLHNEFFSFKPTFKIWIRGNHKPIVTDDSKGAWRRIRLIPFKNQIDEGQVDYDLERKLLTEKEGILGWLIEGCLLWLSDRLEPSPAIRKNSDEYKDESDVLKEFIEANCLLDKTAKVDQRGLWNRWQFWAKEMGFYPGTKSSFTRRLSDRGIDSRGYLGKERAYVGIKLSNFS